MKKNARTKFIVEGLIAVYIAASPILFYLYKYMPNEESVKFLFMDIGSHGFESVGIYFYYLFSKIVPLFLLVIWFVTSKSWWYHAILIPIAMYAFQLVAVFTFESGKVDENEILYVIGVSMIITPVVYFIRLKLVDKYVHGIDLKAMDTELQILKAKEELRKEREALKKEKEAAKKT